MTGEPATDKKKTIDVDIRERTEAHCREIMADHPEVEAVGVMFLSKHLAGTLAGMVVGAEGSRLRPDQNVRMFEVWVKVGMLLISNNLKDHVDMDAALGKLAREFRDAQAKINAAKPRAEGPVEGGP
jgi:hypothetical protein